MFSHSCLSVVAMGEKSRLLVKLHHFCVSESMPALYVIFAIPSSVTLNDVSLIFSQGVNPVQICCLGV